MAHSVKYYFNLFVNKNASMKASCVIHPDCEPMIIVRKWQLDFCNGNKSAAALMVKNTNMRDTNQDTATPYANWVKMDLMVDNKSMQILAVESTADDV